MRRSAKAAVAVVLLVLAVAIPSAVAQAELFRVSIYLDKVTYTPLDESVDVSGCLSSEGGSVLGRQVTLRVYGPEGEIVLSETAPVDSTCNFGLRIDTQSFSEYGNYAVVATHETASDRQAFRFSDETNAKQEGECAESYCTFYFELEGRLHQVNYKLTSGKLDSIMVDLPAKALMLLMNSTTSNGTMTAVLPRQVIDSSENGTDIRYKVFIGTLTNGVEHVAHEELASTESDRSIVVNYPASDERILISINGTYLAPEFGVTLITAAAVFGIIAVAVRIVKYTYGNTLG